MLRGSHAFDVKLVRWPAESDARERYHEEGKLRVLIIEGDVPAPLCSDIREDWVRAPISERDLHARIAALRAKWHSLAVPYVDPSGALRYRERVVPISPVETRLLGILTSKFGSIAEREELSKCLERKNSCDDA